MKKSLLTAITMLMMMLGINAQQNTKNDVILKLNGEELSGKIIEITDDEVKFSYAGETLVYSIKKADILKINFGSGRIEIINKQPLPSEAGQSSAAPKTGGPGLAEHHNKVAILPFAFLRDGQSTADEISLKVQTECYSFLSKHSGIMTIMDPRTSNALLIKAGITKENIKGYTMEDLCNALGVEYVIDGIVSVNKTQQTSITTGNANTTYNSKNNDKNNSWNSKEKTSGSVISTNTQNYETTISLSIYNDKGNSIYSQDRRSFWNTQDAYTSTLEYLLKRTPLYQK